MSETPSDPMIGRLIDGRYQVRSRIARGGMATVYLATDLRLERRVAIKIMHGHLADDNAFKARFVQEARSAARLAHPNVVNVYDQGQDADMAYLVMEYLPGITLRDLLKDYGRLTPEQTVDILEAVLSGLAAAHKAGIVHRDLKPENVLLADDGRIKIGDFGLARAVNNNTATGQALLGTIAYLSPELVTRGIADARSDIYALGIMTFEMLTGEQPYVGEAPMQIAYQHANDTVPMPSSKVPGLPSELDELVLWATARDPQERPADARAMLDQLLDIDNLVRPVRLVGLAGSTMAIDGLTGVQPTLALAATAPDSALNDADTQIFGSTALSAGVSATGSANSGPIDGATGSVKVLATSSAKRKRRGGWLFVIILILALVAGGGGWYFGSGPGSQVTLPTLVSSTPEEAASQLAALGLEVVLGEEFSGTIDQGLVSSTLPAAGQSVTKGSTVTVNVSQGLQPITLPVLAGLSRDDAFAAVTALNALVGAEDDVFSDSVPAGQVIAATRDSDGAEVSSGGEYFEGLAVSFLVSLGPVPNVAGQSVADASRTLGAVGLETQVVEERFSNDVARGIVISAGASADGPVRTGDTISLVVSKGEDLVEVPDVIDGQTVADAREQLEDLGFSVKSNVPGFLEGGVIARVQTPEAGSMARRGSEISVNF